MNRLNYLLTRILLLVVLPLFLTTLLGQIKLEKLLSESPMKASEELELLLPEIVATQIAITMPEEAIKAQAVLARTALLFAGQQGEDWQEGFSPSRLQEVWGENYESYYQKLEGLIAETKGQTLQYQGAYIYAPYHFASSGNTRSMAEYNFRQQMPYLTGVACHSDTEAEGYLNVYYWEAEEFLALCEKAFPESEVTDVSQVRVMKRDSSDYVLEIQVGDEVYEGEVFRKELDLPSACFQIACLEDGVRVVTLGQGHGFGLSQYTAAQMAEEGHTYAEILEYFFKGATLTE